MFAMLGYGVTVDGVYDDRLEAVVAAFQRHWRPEKVDGVAEPSTDHHAARPAGGNAVRPRGLMRRWKALRRKANAPKDRLTSPA